MCQTKAEGGKRCAAHLPASRATIAHAVASTGLDEREARAVFHDLRKEGADLPDPTQQDVEDFITQTEFQVRHDDHLTDKQRKSILGRLRQAWEELQNKILPDAGTFHAWKHMLSECWSRMRRKTVAAGLVGVIGIGALAGCGTPANDNSTAPPSDGGPVATAPATPGPIQADYQSTPLAASAFDSVATPTGPGVDKFGADDVNYAYQDMVRFTFEEGLDHPRILGGANADEPSDFASVREYMSPDGQAAFDDSLSKALAGDEQAITEVNAVVLYDATYGSPYTYRQDGKPVIGEKRFGPATTDVSVNQHGQEQLVMRFEVESDVRVNDADGNPVIVTMGRDNTFWLVRDGSNWKIDGWQVEFSAKPPVPDAKAA